MPQPEEKKDIQEIVDKDTLGEQQEKAVPVESEKDASGKDADQVDDASKQEELEKKKKEFEALVRKLDAQNKKLIPSNDLPISLQDELVQGIDRLTDLRVEVTEKQKALLGQNKKIKDQIEEIAKAKKIAIKADKFAESEKSIEQYVTLLKNIEAEVEHEIAYLQRLHALKEPTFIVVHKYDPFLYEEYIASKVLSVKRYIKTVRKNLDVSFSRYTFGLENQIKSLQYLQLSLGENAHDHA